MTAAYNSTMTDSKLNKKKQFADPSFGKLTSPLSRVSIRQLLTLGINLFDVLTHCPSLGLAIAVLIMLMLKFHQEHMNPKPPFLGSCTPDSNVRYQSF